MASNKMQIEYLRLDQLNDYHRQLRTYSKQTINKTIRLIQDCGFAVPIAIDADNTVVIGQHFVTAARQIKLEAVPAVCIDHLTERQIRTLRIAYDKLLEEGDWNLPELSLEFENLKLEFPEVDLTLTAFELDEINLLLDVGQTPEPEDDIPPIESGPSIVQLGETWQLGQHLLHCGDARKPESYQAVMGNDLAQAIFTDPPYNVAIDGHVCGGGKIKHREFAMASGEMTEQEFITFLRDFITHAIQFSVDGSLHYICMDWRHLYELLMVGRKAYDELKNICVWNKTNGGMGSQYRSKHELITVFKHGKAAHINNVELGKNGRYRTNVWDYAGVNTMGKDRLDELAMHPTVKPVAMVVDAIKDCTRRGDIILDPFGGSGSTLIAAEQTDRQARLIELDPHYCDVIIRRWQQQTGGTAMNAQTNQPFNQQLEDQTCQMI